MKKSELISELNKFDEDEDEDVMIMLYGVRGIDDAMAYEIKTVYRLSNSKVIGLWP
jgi:hypothetical protein